MKFYSMIKLKHNLNMVKLQLFILKKPLIGPPHENNTFLVSVASAGCLNRGLNLLKSRSLMTVNGLGLVKKGFVLYLISTQK